ncbi:MAG: protease modulator HflK, partial [Nitrosomonadaceae bacterium]|nr:protease modulator HflK [Nitrosomonadaceae bacterium]
MGLNDPQWGKNKGDSGPPDLDDVLRNVNKKINNIFGQKKGGGGDDGSGSNTPSPKPQSGSSIAMILGLLAVVWSASGFYIVDEGHRGVV